MRRSHARVAAGERSDILRDVRRIDDAVGAERLARAIVADLVRHHEAEIITHAPALGSAVHEGRALFQQRVDPALHGVFEDVVASSQLAPWGAPVRAEEYRGARPVVPLAGSPAPDPPHSSAWIPILMALAAVSVAVFYYFTWYLKR